VASIASAIARRDGLDHDTIEGIDLAARIHGHWKDRDAREILSRPTNLSPMEWELIKIHAQAGADIIKGVTFPWPVAEMIVANTMNAWTARGTRADFGGRRSASGPGFIAVADTVEAMSSHRPYRPALGVDAAVEEIVNDAARLFEPAVVDAVRGSCS